MKRYLLAIVILLASRAISSPPAAFHASQMASSAECADIFVQSDRPEPSTEVIRRMLGGRKLSELSQGEMLRIGEEMLNGRTELSPASRAQIESARSRNFLDFTKALSEFNQKRQIKSFDQFVAKLSLQDQLSEMQIEKLANKMYLFLYPREIWKTPEARAILPEDFLSRVAMIDSYQRVTREFLYHGLVDGFSDLGIIRENKWNEPILEVRRRLRMVWQISLVGLTVSGMVGTHFQVLSLYPPEVPVLIRNAKIDQAVNIAELKGINAGLDYLFNPLNGATNALKTKATYDRVQRILVTVAIAVGIATAWQSGWIDGKHKVAVRKQAAESVQDVLDPRTPAPKHQPTTDELVSQEIALKKSEPEFQADPPELQKLELNAAEKAIRDERAQQGLH